MKKARPWRGRKNTKKEIRLVKPNPKCLISHECVSNLTVFIQPWDNMLHTGNFDLWSKLLHRASVYSSATGNCLIVNVLFWISALLCSKALYGDNVCFKWCDVFKKNVCAQCAPLKGALRLLLVAFRVVITAKVYCRGFRLSTKATLVLRRFGEAHLKRVHVSIHTNTRAGHSSTPGASLRGGSARFGLPSGRIAVLASVELD